MRNAVLSAQAPAESVQPSTRYCSPAPPLPRGWTGQLRAASPHSSEAESPAPPSWGSSCLSPAPSPLLGPCASPTGQAGGRAEPGRAAAVLRPPLAAGFHPGGATRRPLQTQLLNIFSNSIILNYHFFFFLNCFLSHVDTDFCWSPTRLGPTRQNHGAMC